MEVPYISMTPCDPMVDAIDNVPVVASLNTSPVTIPYLYGCMTVPTSAMTNGDESTWKIQAGPRLPHECCLNHTPVGLRLYRIAVYALVGRMYCGVYTTSSPFIITMADYILRMRHFSDRLLSNEGASDNLMLEVEFMLEDPGTGVFAKFELESAVFGQIVRRVCVEWELMDRRIVGRFIPFLDDDRFAFGRPSHATTGRGCPLRRVLAIGDDMIFCAFAGTKGVVRGLGMFDIPWDDAVLNVDRITCITLVEGGAHALSVRPLHGESCLQRACSCDNPSADVIMALLNIPEVIASLTTYAISEHPFLYLMHTSIRVLSNLPVHPLKVEFFNMRGEYTGGNVLHAHHEVCNDFDDDDVRDQFVDHLKIMGVEDLLLTPDNTGCMPIHLYMEHGCYNVAYAMLERMGKSDVMADMLCADGKMTVLRYVLENILSWMMKASTDYSWLCSMIEHSTPSLHRGPSSRSRTLLSLACDSWTIQRTRCVIEALMKHGYAHQACVQLNKGYTPLMSWIRSNASKRADPTAQKYKDLRTLLHFPQIRKSIPLTNSTGAHAYYLADRHDPGMVEVMDEVLDHYATETIFFSADKRLWPTPQDNTHKCALKDSFYSSKLCDVNVLGIVKSYLSQSLC